MKEVLGYFIVGDRPVKFVALEGDKVGAEAYDWDTGSFISAPEYIGHILFSTGDTEAVSQEGIQKQTLRVRFDHSKTPVSKGFERFSTDKIIQAERID